MRRVLLVLAALVFASPAVAQPTCDPACGDGQQCNEAGKCVRPCDPPCEGGAVCSAGGLCANDVAPPTPPTPPPTPTKPNESDPSAQKPGASYPYDRFRVGAGILIGFGFTPDGSGFAFGASSALVLPIGEHFYVRPEIGGLYFQTSTSETIQTSNTFQATYRDTDHLLFYTRPMVGYQVTPLVSVRVGPLLGYRLASVEQGACGPGLSRRTFGSAALGGSGALAFHTMGADIALGIDAFGATTHGFCDTTAGTTRGVLAHANDVATQLTLLATYLF